MSVLYTVNVNSMLIKVSYHHYHAFKVEYGLIGV
jgi:hypothetical protein